MTAYIFVIEILASETENAKSASDETPQADPAVLQSSNYPGHCDYIDSVSENQFCSTAVPSNSM